MRGYPQGAGLPIESIFPDKIRKITPEISYKLTANIPASSPKVISVNRFGSSFPAEQYQIEYHTKDKKFDLPIKLVVLTNGSAQSSGDYRPFIYRSIYNATIIGSPTAGAMASFTNYHIPGNIRLWLSWRAIDRKGIQPDIFVQPTIKGTQADRDEVLERAIKYLQTGR
jgi:C-terminal processing protease CtpA/Prc